MAKFRVPNAPETLNPIPDLAERILVEQDGVIVVDKPPGLPSTGRTLDDPDSLQFWLVQRYRRMVWAIHQLDADTSGANVFVARKSLVPAWQQRLKFPSARKTYVAVIHGALPKPRVRVDAAIGRVTRRGRPSWGAVDDGKASATRFETLAEADGHALIAATLETGRTHQIRVHLEALGLSLVGEGWYREPPCALHPRQALHAARIALREPLGEVSAFVAPPPADLVALAARLGLGALRELPPPAGRDRARR